MRDTDAARQLLAAFEALEQLLAAYRIGGSLRTPGKAIDTISRVKGNLAEIREALAADDSPRVTREQVAEAIDAPIHRWSVHVNERGQVVEGPQPQLAGDVADAVMALLDQPADGHTETDGG